MTTDELVAAWAKGAEKATELIAKDVVHWLNRFARATARPKKGDEPLNLAVLITMLRTHVETRNVRNLVVMELASELGRALETPERKKRVNAARIAAPVLMRVKVCPACARPFVPGRRDARGCSPACCRLIRVWKTRGVLDRHAKVVVCATDEVESPGTGSTRRAAQALRREVRPRAGTE